MASSMSIGDQASSSAVFATPVMHDPSPSLAQNLQLQTEYDNELSRFSRPLLDFAATMTVLIMVVGILGNLLTIVALIRCPRVRNVAAAFIISLCVADFMFCTFVLPFSSSRFIYGTWIHGDFLCQLFPFMRYGNIGVSLLLIAMITVNRYIMIAHHNVYNRIYKKLWIGAMIAFCWMFSFGMQIPTLLGVWGIFGLDKKLGTCTILNDSNGNSAKTALFIIAFLIPCCVIICCYALIFWVVHKSESRVREHAVGSHPKAPKSKSKEHRDLKTKRNEWRITKMVLAIFLSFVICYLPITIVKVADKDVHFPGFHVLGYIMLYLSACINPIIYVIMNKQYRQAYKTVILWRRPRLLSLTPVGSSYGDKSNDGQSRTMVSQVSIAMAPIVLSKKSEELPEVFDDNL
ncbi:G-protein coupled receptor moody-like isoform X2 [Zootermopsis nevadensis]|uniref:G-protein coupled receptor moody-like isoform X2 n=1 Tax=Zootermopsis nevadensis TaxID=136037 RepID=UPI000B8E2C66|nr:G-protein coupled receptor moody-like isoform X2 [Zootermopsis nevadensis]